MKFLSGSFPLLSANSAGAPSGGIDWTLALSTLITGMVVVFSVLILLVFLIWLFASLIHWFDGRKAAKAAKRESLKMMPPPPPVPLESAAPSAPAEEPGGIPQEVVAVISAAVSSVTGGKGKVHSIRETRTPRGIRPAWSSAGLLDNTRPF